MVIPGRPPERECVLTQVKITHLRGYLITCVKFFERISLQIHHPSEYIIGMVLQLIKLYWKILWGSVFRWHKRCCVILWLQRILRIIVSRGKTYWCRKSFDACLARWNLCQDPRFQPKKNLWQLSVRAVRTGQYG